MNEVPVGFGDVQRIEAGEARRVVHQAVQPVEPLAHLGKQPVNGRHAGKVGMEQLRSAALLGGALRLCFRRAVVDAHAISLTRQAHGDAPANPFRRARHQNTPPVHGCHCDTCAAAPLTLVP